MWFYSCIYKMFFSYSHVVNGNVHIFFMVYACARVQIKLYAYMMYMYSTARNIPKIWVLIHPTAPLQGPCGMQKRRAWEIRLESRIDPEDGKPGMLLYINMLLMFVDL